MIISNLNTNFRFVLGFVVLTFAVGCSSKILSENQTNLSPTPSATPESCEMFAGQWQSNRFGNIEDESKLICDGKPCADHNRGGADFRLTCTDGKITGEVVLSTDTPHNHSNIALKESKTPEPLRETTTPLKVGRVENGVLYLSYIFDSVTDTDCLSEISVKPKGDLLVGTYKLLGCKKKGLLSSRTEELLRVKPTGGIVFEKW